MANKLLLPVYNRIFDESFSYKEFEHRLQMQKMVYLLQEVGVNIGHYRFDWYKHGPYSQVLLDDMYVEKGIPIAKLNYRADTEARIDKIKEIFWDKEAINEYGMSNWTECLASIHFLKKNIMGSGTSKETLLSELEDRKTHLNNKVLNNKAYELIENLFE